MNWTEALPVVVAQTGHKRFVWLCSDDNPDARSREDHRRLMVEIASGEQQPAAGDDPSAAHDTSWLPGPCGGCG